MTYLFAFDRCEMGVEPMTFKRRLDTLITELDGGRLLTSLVIYLAQVNFLSQDSEHERL